MPLGPLRRLGLASLGRGLASTLGLASMGMGVAAPGLRAPLLGVALLVKALCPLVAPLAASTRCRTGLCPEKFGAAAARTPARLHRNQADDRFAQALAGLSKRLQLVEPDTLDPDEIAALCSPLRLIGCRADRERGLDRVERGGRDGDADHSRAPGAGPADEG